MRIRQPYTHHVIEATSYELGDGSGFVPDLFIERHNDEDIEVAQFFVPGVFDSHDAALGAAILAGRRKIDEGSVTRRIEAQTPAT